ELVEKLLQFDVIHQKPAQLTPGGFALELPDAVYDLLITPAAERLVRRPIALFDIAAAVAKHEIGKGVVGAEAARNDMVNVTVRPIAVEVSARKWTRSEEH